MQSLQLPPGIRLQYFAEGAANIVYRMILPPDSPALSSASDPDDQQYGTGTPPPTEIAGPTWQSLLKGKLLRLRKDVATATSVAESQKAFEKNVKPSFRDDDLVEQTLVDLVPELISSCNEELRSMERAMTRSQKRHGVYLNVHEKYGLLVTDMSITGGKEVVLVEFKPKWLAQSPSAPRNAVRCRTCALRAMRNIKKEVSDPVAEAGFCPLDLVSPVKENVELAVQRIIDGDRLGEKTPSLKSRLLLFLFQCPLLVRLRDEQVRLDKKGPFVSESVDEEYLTAMTLRDCTMFLKVAVPHHALCYPVLMYT